MGNLEICAVVFCIIFFFICLLRIWHTKSELTGDDVFAAMFLSVCFGIILTPIIIVICFFRGLAALFNKMFDKL